MDLLIQRCFDGMFNGAIYATLAIALSSIYRSTGLLNLAQGEMALFSGYSALVFVTAPGKVGVSFSLAGTTLASKYLPGHPWPIAIGILAAMIVGAVLGVLVQKLVMRPRILKSSLAQINITIGLLLLINGLIVWIWRDSTRAFPSPFPNEFDDFIGIAGARLRYTTLGVWFVLFAVIGLLGLLLTRTKLGLAFRAITSNESSAALVGVNVDRTIAIGWAIASAIGALAACLVAGALVVEPTLMIRLLIFAFAAATIGGLDSPAGAIAGGLIVGLSQSLIPGYLGVPSELSLLPAVGAMTLVLLIRPYGLFGRKSIARV